MAGYSHRADDAPGRHSHLRAEASSAQIDLPAPQLPLLVSVQEAALLLGVGVRTVWRMLADPNSAFPRPRRLRGRTLLVRAEVLAFAMGAS